MFYFLGTCQRWQFIFPNPAALISVGEEIGKSQYFRDILKKFDDCVVLAKVFFLLNSLTANTLDQSECFGKEFGKLPYSTSSAETLM